jgi:hypothetical protein
VVEKIKFEEKVMKSKARMFRTLVAAGVLVLFSTCSAFGQTGTRFNVPFPFLAGEQVMPAGQYLVSVDQGARTVSLRHQDGSSVLSLRLIPGKRGSGAVDSGKLLFKVYGNARVLSRIWTRGYPDAGDLAMSNAEKELARTERAGQPIEIALSLPR